MPKPSPNHGTVGKPNDDDNDDPVLKVHNFSPGTIGWTRPRDHPRRRWLDCVPQDLAVIDLPLAEAVRIAQHRIDWRAILRRVTSKLDDQQEL